MPKEDDYAIYKALKTQDDYFLTWNHGDVKQLTKELKDHIYKKYLVKREVFNRDSFKCQNKDCTSPNTPLTMHHVKAKRNNGGDKARNCVTLCSSCHQSYEKAKKAISFTIEAVHLPPHLKGHTFKLHKIEQVNWKKLKIEMRKLRKQLKAQGLKPMIDWEMVMILMRWLSVPYYEFDDDDIE